MKDYTMKVSKTIQSIFAIVFWLAIWAVASKLMGNQVILPSPKSAIFALFHMFLTGSFYVNVLATLYRVTAGIFFSFVFGLITALLSYYISIFRVLLKPLVGVIKATPVMAVIIFALLWMTSGNLPVFVCFLMCYPVIYTNILMGMDSMDKSFLEMAKIYNVSVKKQIKFVYIPGILPHIKSALSLVCGLSWKTVVASEVLAVPRFSMGYRLMDSKIYFETDQLFAWIAAIVILSMLFEKLMKYLLSGKFLIRIKKYEMKRVGHD